MKKLLIVTQAIDLDDPILGFFHHWVEMLAPHPNSRIYDPCCGSGGKPNPSESRSEAQTASRRLPAGRAQRGNMAEFEKG